MLTEQSNPLSQEIDGLSTLEMLQIINAEDQKVALAVQAVLPQIMQAVDVITQALSDGGRLFYVGAGTSGRLGVLDAAECVPTFGTAPSLVQALIAGGEAAMIEAVEGAEDDRQLAIEDLQVRALTATDVLVGIAASGRTPYVIAALEYAGTIGVRTVGLACNVPAPVLDAADIQIGVQVGPEVIAGSTRMKAGTAQKMVLNMLSTVTMIKLGKVYGNLMVDVQVTNEKLARRAKQIIMQITGCDVETSERLIHEADNNVKVAIVMHRRAVNRAEAQRLLDEAKGYLRAIID